MNRQFINFFQVLQTYLDTTYKFRGSKESKGI